MADEIENTETTLPEPGAAEVEAPTEQPAPKGLIFDGGEHRGFPTNLAIRERFPSGRIHIHFNRRADGYVYRDNHARKPMFFPDPNQPTKAYFAGEEIPDGR